MEFAYRIHKTFVNLDPGETMHFALPPMTAGSMVIWVERITVGGVDQPGGHPHDEDSAPEMPRIDPDV